MTLLRLHIDEATVYEGPPLAVPRAGDDIHHDGEIVRVEAVVWDFGAGDVVSVGLVAGNRPYTF
jgi:hypothetical protein